MKLSTLFFITAHQAAAFVGPKLAFRCHKSLEKDCDNADFVEKRLKLFLIGFTALTQKSFENLSLNSSFVKR